MGKIKENETMSKNNILLIGYDSNICLGVCYCLSKVQNVNLYLLTNNPKHAGKFSRYIKKVINYSSLNLDIIRNSVVQFNINVIFPYDEEEGVFVSENINSIEIKTTKCILLTEPEKYRLGINKLRLAEFLYSNNISVPEFIQNKKRDELSNVLKEWNDAFIMKPSRSSFGRGILKFQNYSDFEIYAAKNKLDFTNFIFQRYIEGSDLTVNVIAKNGEILDFTIQETPNKTDKTFVSGDEFEFKSDEQAFVLVKKAIHLLNWNGIACFDLRRNKDTDKIYILEINGRFWASLVAAFEKGGINFPRIALQLALGEEVTQQDKKFDKQISGTTYLKNLVPYKKYSFSQTKYMPYLYDPFARAFQFIN